MKGKTRSQGLTEETTRSTQPPCKRQQTLSTEYGWIYSRPDRKFRKVCCKLIRAVGVSRKMKETAIETVTVREVDLGRCKFCDSPDITRKGIRKLKKGTFQQFRCRDCGRRFTHNLGFERKRATPEQITMAIGLLFSGLSSRNAATFIRMTGADASHVTVQNWAREYAGLMDKFMDSITPLVGEQWRTDEIYLRIRGNRRYLLDMLDSDTRYWLAKMVAEHKGNDDVEPMFKKAKELAGKVPSRLVSDGAANFAYAHRKQFAPKSAMDKESTHERHIHMDGDTNNNQMESFNGNTVRAAGESDQRPQKGRLRHHDRPPVVLQQCPATPRPAWQDDSRRGGRHQNRGRQQVEDHDPGGGKVRHLSHFFCWATNATAHPSTRICYGPAATRDRYPCSVSWGTAIAGAHVHH